MRVALRCSLLVVVAALSILGCSRPAAPGLRLPTKAEYDRIKEGMTTEEVKAILGEPHQLYEKEDMPEEVREAWKEDMWRWGGKRQFGKAVRVYFKDGKVSKKDSHGLD